MGSARDILIPEFRSLTDKSLHQRNTIRVVKQDDADPMGA